MAPQVKVKDKSKLIITLNRYTRNHRATWPIIWISLNVIMQTALFGQLKAFNLGLVFTTPTIHILFITDGDLLRYLNITITLRTNTWTVWLKEDVASLVVKGLIVRFKFSHMLILRIMALFLCHSLRSNISLILPGLPTVLHGNQGKSRKFQFRSDFAVVGKITLCWSM